MVVFFTFLFSACSDYDFKELQDGENVADTGASPGITDTGNTPSESDSGQDQADTAITEEPDIATEFIYLNSENQLFSWNPGEGKVLVGTFSDNSVRMTDIAIDLDGNMYGIASTELYRIDSQTAEVTYECSVDQYANGLTFISNGQLLAAGAGIFVIDLDTCLTTVISTGSGYQTAGDVVGLPGERLFWTVNGSAGDGLVEVNPNTGESTLIGYLGIDSLWGVGYADGLLYGFSSTGDAVVIDPDTANVLAVENISGVWWGATTNPVRW